MRVMKKFSVIRRLDLVLILDLDIDYKCLQNKINLGSKFEYILNE